MREATVEDVSAVQVDTPTPVVFAEKSSLQRAMNVVSFRNISAIYIFVALFAIFSIWVPSTFLTTGVWKSMLAGQAMVAITAVGVAIPLAAGLFDLAVGAEVGIAGILVAWLLHKQGMPILPAIVLAVLAGGIIGSVSGLLVVRAHIDSFIATLGMSSVLIALTDWISSNEQILGLSTNFQKIATKVVFGLTLPFWFMLALGVVVWYVLERTPVGRRVYATGGNMSSARLSGVKTSHVVVGALAACGALAALAGILQTSLTATGDPTVGPGFLLPAYAAAFLGSTQFRGGRYNVWGTIVAVYVLATGVTGLQLAGAPVWIPNLFNGLALLIAVAMASAGRARTRTMAIRRVMKRGRVSRDA